MYFLFQIARHHEICFTEPKINKESSGKWLVATIIWRSAGDSTSHRLVLSWMSKTDEWGGWRKICIKRKKRKKKDGYLLGTGNKKSHAANKLCEWSQRQGENLNGPITFRWSVIGLLSSRDYCFFVFVFFFASHNRRSQFLFSSLCFRRFTFRDIATQTGTLTCRLFHKRALTHTTIEWIGQKERQLSSLSLAEQGRPKFKILPSTNKSFPLKIMIIIIIARKMMTKDRQRERTIAVRVTETSVHYFTGCCTMAALWWTNSEMNMIYIDKDAACFPPGALLLLRRTRGHRVATTLHLEDQNCQNYTRVMTAHRLTRGVRSLTEGGMAPNGIIGGGAPKCGGAIVLAEPSSAFSSSRRFRQAAFGFKFLSAKSHPTQSQFDSLFSLTNCYSSAIQMQKPSIQI